MKRKQNEIYPTEGQKNPDLLTTEFVQVWKDTGMVTACMPLEIAKEAVREGRAAVITSQAINRLKENGAFA